MHNDWSSESIFKISSHIIFCINKLNYFLQEQPYRLYRDDEYAEEEANAERFKLFRLLLIFSSLIVFYPRLARFSFFIMLTFYELKFTQESI